MTKLEAFTPIVLVLGVLLILATVILVGQNMRNDRAENVELERIVLTFTVPEGYTCSMNTMAGVHVYTCRPWR